MTTPLQRTSLGELGGYNPLLATSLGELGADVEPTPPPFTPEPTFPPGAEDAEARWRRIIVEDEMIMLVIQAWLTMKDR